MIRSLHARHRAIEFKKFLVKIDKEVPADLDIYMILDIYATLKTPQVKRWLAGHRRFHLHFTPTGASWINLVERWFAELTARQLKRGTHRSVAELNADIEDWVEHWNEDPGPYVWVKSADEILAALAGDCNVINASVTLTVALTAEGHTTTVATQKLTISAKHKRKGGRHKVRST